MSLTKRFFGRDKNSTLRAQEDDEKKPVANDGVEEVDDEEEKTGKSDQHDEEEPKAGDGGDEDSIDEDEPKALVHERKRVAKINKVFGKKDPAFALRAIEKGWSPTEAKANYADVLEARQLAEGAGNRPVTRDGDDGDDSEAFAADEHPFMALVKQKEREGVPRARAVSLATREAPDLHEDFIRSAN